jgi:hypothetical protein
MRIFSFIVAGLCLARAAEPSSAEPLSFQEFFEPSAQVLKPSAHLLSLNRKRVRLVGYMAQMDEPPRGGFYLCRFPVFAAEGGGGTADLPPDAVLVVVKSARGKELAHVPRPLEVTGVLEIGPQVDEGGRISRIRILLDGPASTCKIEEPTGDRQ